MKIKTTQQEAPEPPFMPVTLEILIETKREGEVVQALFNALQIEAVTKKEFGATTEFLDIPGVDDRVTIRLQEALREFYTKK